MHIKSILIMVAAVLALPAIVTSCASTGDDPDGRSVEDLGRAVEEHLPGLGNNPTTDDDRFHR